MVERGARLVRACLWRRADPVGLERFELLNQGDRWILRGTILTAGDAGPAEARYRVICDAAWRTERAEVSIRRGATEGALSLVPEAGRWYLDGREVEAVRGAADVDLGWSPSTNTLPIRRLGLVRFPELEIEPLSQEYARLSDRTYRYRSGDGAFAADLLVDDLGLVVTYSGAWERVTGGR